LPESDRSFAQNQLRLFIRWFGGDHAVSALTGSEVNSFAERLAQTDRDFGDKIEPVKGFLTYAWKEKWSRENLSTAIKVKKSKGKTIGPAQKLKREPVPMVRAKYDELTAELAALRARRLELIVDIQRAAADKDFRENAPFHAAREQKGHVEGRIMEIDEMLASAVITAENQGTGHCIAIGDTVVIVTESGGSELRYKILGKQEGDVVEVSVPAGKLRYRIKCVER
jgi:transcription elongation factor GreA